MGNREGRHFGCEPNLRYYAGTARGKTDREALACLKGVLSGGILLPGQGLLHRLLHGRYPGEQAAGRQRSLSQRLGAPRRPFLDEGADRLLGHRPTEPVTSVRERI